LSNPSRSLHNPTAKAIARAIQGAREEQRPEISQRDLAKKLKWPHSVVGMIESGQRHVRVAELIAIAKALGMSPEELFRRCLH
jgi:ribosome-binding protein aMBF1 (putative translation factor)